MNELDNTQLLTAIMLLSEGADVFLNMADEYVADETINQSERAFLKAYFDKIGTTFTAEYMKRVGTTQGFADIMGIYAGLPWSHLYS